MLRRIPNIVAAVAVLAAAPHLAHAQTRDGTLEYFDGGSIRSDVRLSLGFLYGAGAAPDGLGAPISTVHSGVASISGNPSGLAYLAAGGVLVDVLPPVGASVSDIADLEERAARSIDDAIEDVTAHGMIPDYPEVAAQAGQQAGLVSGALAFRVGPAVMGASLDEPMVLELELVGNGIETFAGGVKSDGSDDVDIDMRGFADVACDLSFAVDRVTGAVATDLGNGIGLGVSLSRYHASATVDGMLRGDGVVDYGGQEYVFNDPDDAWDNELGGSLRGSYEGDGLGWSIGASYRALGWVTLDALYSNVPRLSLSGSLVTIESMPPAVSDNGVDLDEVTASQPTYTETEVTVEDDDVMLNLPSYAGFAATFEVVGVDATLEYRRYSGALGFEHDGHVEGVDMANALGLELRYRGLSLGGGFITGTLVGESAEDADRTDVLIPLANVGMGFELGESASVDLLVLALPLQVARVSFSYEF